MGEFGARLTERTHVNWEAVTAIATVFTGCVIAVTAIIGVYQLGQLHQQRRDAAAVELMRSLQDTTFARAFLTILALPAGATACELRALGQQAEEAALILEMRFETLGQLVYRDTISFEVFEELVGGAVLTVWNRLRDAVRQTREEKSWPTFCEWFQWLAERLAERGRLEQTPAHIRLRGVDRRGRPSTGSG